MTIDNWHFDHFDFTSFKVAIDFYNNERPHMSLDWKTPSETALCTGEFQKKWISYRENAIKTLAAWIIIRNFVATSGND